MVLLQAGQAAGSSWSGLLMIVIIFVIMWLFMIRPQQKKQKEIENQRNALKNGDAVVTAGGIHGKLKEINKEQGTVLVEIADGVRIRVDLTSVFAAPAVEKKQKEEKKD